MARGDRRGLAGAITGVGLPVDCGFRDALSWQSMAGVPYPEAD